MNMKAMMLIWVLNLFASTSLWVPEANADYPKPLSEHVGESDLSYIANRCGGLVVSILSVSGEESSVSSHLASIYEFYQGYSVLYLGETQGLSDGDAVRSVLRNFKEFARVYVEYLNASYVATGEYVTDPLVLGDISTCSGIKDHIQGN
ncbi:hypothetical protein [Roseovarius mucosus]|nr:hypothetical protein [Roseovarius mucosus]